MMWARLMYQTFKGDFGSFANGIVHQPGVRLKQKMLPIAAKMGGSLGIESMVLSEDPFL